MVLVGTLCTQSFREQCGRRVSGTLVGTLRSQGTGEHWGRRVRERDGKVYLGLKLLYNIYIILNIY